MSIASGKRRGVVTAGGRAGYRANEEEGYFSILLLCTQPGSEAGWCRCPGQRCGRL